MTAIRPHRLLHDSLLRSAESTPSKPALVVGDATATYEELLEDAMRLARAFQDLGLKRGDRVVLYMDNSKACTVAIFAALLAGGVFVVVNPQTKEDKLAYILADCEATILVTEGAISSIGVAAAAGIESLVATIVASPPTAIAAEFVLEELIERGDASVRETGVIPLDLAALIYTSGSTGLPKGVMMRHQNMTFAAESIAQYLRLEEDERILGLLPLAFDYGLYQLLMSTRLGATLVLERSFAYPAQTLRRVVDEEVTVFPGVPTVYATLLSMHEKSPLELPTVRRVTNTAAALLPAMQQGLREIFPNALIFAMYGLTECKRVSYLEPELLAAKPSSVGRPIPGTEAMVLDEKGDRVAPGEPGVLYVRGPHVMAGYWRKPELTADMLKDGPTLGERMLCTHDQFTVDEDGFLYFVGRTDDIIKTRGEKVSPLEVENALFAITGVREAAVIGVPDDVLGESICAYVVLEDGAELTDREIIAACRAKLEAFMAPSEVVFLGELPKTTSGKVRKQSLRE